MNAGQTLSRPFFFLSLFQLDSVRCFLWHKQCAFTAAVLLLIAHYKQGHSKVTGSVTLFAATLLQVIIGNPISNQISDLY